MSETPADTPKRQRAPSKRALQTKARVLDAAETVFSIKGFDGATIRDIAAEAGEPVGTIHHHGGGKERLYHQAVARRAGPLAERRLAALAAVKAAGDVTIERVLTAFCSPFFDLAQEDPVWRCYARLVAQVSADSRWREIRAAHFDPAFEVFLEELSALLPDVPRRHIVATFVFSVSALLALLTSRDRIGEFEAGDIQDTEDLRSLIRFCAGGMAAG
ncbi:MAG: TetR/AcrR family transcriptional regulator [Rhodobacteraceae bacterium]|nr:TetR/AcrR family transcriptional regulator [Paracoccaceae bacterium]